MAELKRREQLLSAGAATALAACKGKRAGWCGEPLYTDDGAFSYPAECPPTASNTEGPCYLEGAPERAELAIFGDEGTPVRFSGQDVHLVV